MVRINFKPESMRTNWPATTTFQVVRLSVAKTACVLLVFCAVTAIASPAQTFNTLLDFNGTDGANPQFVSLVQGTDGNYYGTTASGGDYNDGTVFRTTPAGVLTTLYSFCSAGGCTDGVSPYAGLVLGTDGNFYGTTYGGGFNGLGTVFKITSAGALTVLHSFANGCVSRFCTYDGKNPYAALVLGSDGNLYGTAFEGGLYGYGTVFKITPAGAFTKLYSFCAASGCTDGANPYAGLVLGTDGNFYGTTYDGGGTNSGTVFKITPKGVLTTLYSFCSQTNCADGVQPLSGLVQGADGNYYGTTSVGGNTSDGTVFNITPAGVLTTLYSFCSQTNCTDGAFPNAGLLQGSDGNYYGTTFAGGTNESCDNGFSCGTVFQITSGGTLTTLYSFQGSNDGSQPVGGLVQGTDGNFYGTANQAGDTACGQNGCGTVFRVSVALSPFVEIRSTSGVEGAKVGIFGQGFDSSSIVKFGGVKATTVKLTGTTYLTATVPAGALTGSVTVTTGSTVLTSTRTFRVRPKVTSFTPLDGAEGTVVTITGTGLKQTSKVTFGGVTATHTAESDTEVEATVPAGAKTGKIAVTTLGGAATSAESFTVTE